MFYIVWNLNYIIFLQMVYYWIGAENTVMTDIYRFLGYGENSRNIRHN